MSSHMIFGRQLSRDTEHRKAMRRNLVQSLFEHGSVRTTPAKAKETKGLAEKLITLAKTNTVNNRRRVIAILQDRRLVDENQDFITEGSKTVVQKLFNEIAPSLSDRQGGYTRIIKLSDFRIGDAGDLVLFQLVTEKGAERGQARRSSGLRRKRGQRKQEFANRVRKAAKGDSAQASAVEAPAAPASAPEGEAAGA